MIHSHLNGVRLVASFLSTLSFQERIDVLKKTVTLLKENHLAILRANRFDLEKLDRKDPKYDRLLLNEERIVELEQNLEKLTLFEDPLNILLRSHIHTNGLHIEQRTVPLGVIGMIYESRPNVTLDAFALCFLSGNVCVLKGGKEAQETNTLFVSLIHQALEASDIPIKACILLPSERSFVDEMCQARGLIDVLIPRGGHTLIDFVKEHSKIPIIETGASAVHLYFDSEGNRDMGAHLIENSKVRRVSVCNALDCLLIHEKRLNDLAILVAPLSQSQVILYADPPSLEALKGFYPDHLLNPIEQHHKGLEFLDYKMCINTVPDVYGAIDYIKKYSLGHSEAIITDDLLTRDAFMALVDAAAVYWNTSTAFTDGGEFGLGAEIGVSTQKLHIRGPFSFEHLVTAKWMIFGEGQIRP